MTAEGVRLMTWAIVWLAVGYGLRHFQSEIWAWVKRRFNGEPGDTIV